MSDAPPRALPILVPKGARYALALVALTNAVSLLDRQILAILAPAIKADLNVGDAEMGLLFGTVFALFYALFSLPLGRLADGWVRTRLLSISLAFWSAATALGGFANSFAVLAVSRLGVGIGEAAAQPAGTSLIYDYWPKHRRGFVMAVLASAIALGIGGSLALGGLAAEWWDGLARAGQAPIALRGWQFALIVASLPGFVLALLMWRLREPVRGAMDGIDTAPDPHPFRASGAVLAAVLPGLHWIVFARRHASRATWGFNLGALVVIVAAMIALTHIAGGLSPRPPMTLAGLTFSAHALQWAVIGFGLLVIVNLMQSMRIADPQAFRVMTKSPTLMMAMAVGALQSVLNYGMMAFNPSFIIRYYNQSMAETAWQFGLLAATMGIIGPLIWGPLSDTLQKRFPGAGRAYVALFAMGLSPDPVLLGVSRADLGRFLPAVRVLQPGADRLDAAALCDHLRSGAAADARHHVERLSVGDDHPRPRHRSLCRRAAVRCDRRSALVDARHQRGRHPDRHPDAADRKARATRRECADRAGGRDRPLRVPG